MPVMDEFQNERDRILKDGTLKEKANYLFYYYKWHALAIIVIAWVVISLIVTIVTHKDPAFYGVIVNGTMVNDDPTFVEDFAKLIEVDTSKEEVVLEADMYLNWDEKDTMTVSTSQKIAVYVSAGDVDIIQSDVSAMNYYAYNGIIYDLRDYLRPDQLEKYEPYFFYADKAIIDAKRIADDTNDYNFELTYPENPYDPSTMEDPIPVAINIKDCTNITKYYYYKSDILLGTFKTTERIEDCVKYLDYIETK